jgi:hypothetical protein
MFVARPLTSFFAFLVCLASPAPFLGSPSAMAMESVRVEHRLQGQTVYSDVHAFDESPLSSPELTSVAKSAELDHVLVVSDEGIPVSKALTELASSMTQDTEVPVLSVKQNTGLWKKLREAWKLSFHHPDRKPDPEDYRYGIVSTIGEAGPFAILVLVDKGIDLPNALALAVAQSALAYYTNVYNHGFNHLLESNINEPGMAVRDRTFFLRKMGYEYFTSQVFKWIQNPAQFLSASVQANVAMNTLMVGAGDSWVSNSLYRAYKGDKVKLAKMNFYTSILSNVFGSLDLIQTAMMPVLFNVYAYEFRLSGVVLLGYYAGLNYWIQKNPEGLYRHIERVDQTLREAGKKIKGVLADCRRLFSGRSSSGRGPLQSGL